MFKKGDKVTIVGSWNRTGTVYVRHYIVSSWGKKQATLIRQDDGSNAKFRVYTDYANLIQGIHSHRMMLTAQYSEALALKIAAEFIASEDVRALERHARATAAGMNVKLEDRLLAEHNATAWQAAMVHA